MKTATSSKTRGSSPKVRLDPDGIVAAGLEVAAASPSLTLSAKELGQRLGSDPTAIYRHFRNKGHLMEALLDALHLKSVTAVSADPSDWENRLRQLATNTLRVFSDHPSVAAEAMVVTTHGPGELAAIELMLDALTVAGLNPDEVVKHYALISSYTLSLASGIARGRAAARAELPESERVTPASEEVAPWLDGPILADPRVYPRIAELSLRLTELHDDELFLLGIESVIDSAKRAAAAHAAQ